MSGDSGSVRVVGDTIEDERKMTGAPLAGEQLEELVPRETDGHPSGGQVGRPVLRYGGLDRVSGTQRFLADLAFTDAAQVVLVTLPVATAGSPPSTTPARPRCPGCSRW